jgi:hypothetical protein
LLAGCDGQGCTEALMLAQGFTVTVMVEPVRAGLASAHSRRMTAGGDRG